MKNFFKKLQILWQMPKTNKLIIDSLESIHDQLENIIKENQVLKDELEKTKNLFSKTNINIPENILMIPNVYNDREEKMKNLNDEDKELYKRVVENIKEERLIDGIFVAAKKVRTEVLEEKERKELYKKEKLLKDIVVLLNNYIDTQIDLWIKIAERKNFHSGIKSELEKAFKSEVY